MDMLILNKRKLIIILFCFFIFNELFSLTLVEVVDKKAEEANENYKFVEVSLEDYFPHVDGVAYLYLNPKNKYNSYIELIFFTSLYKKNYHISYNGYTVSGYIEKTTYTEPYNYKDSINKIENEFSYRISEMKSDKTKIDKYVLFSLELLEEY